MKKTYNAPALSTIQLDMEERILADSTRLGVAADDDTLTEDNYSSRILSIGSASWQEADDEEE